MDHDSPRTLLRDEVDHLDRECARLIAALNELVSSVAPDLLYQRLPDVSIGEYVLRSAATLEQTFGGLTANLWDDPFEWTLPESLSTPELVKEYLEEVDAARRRAFKSIASDRDLTKYISGPSGEPQQLFALLLETLLKASDYYGRALATKNAALTTRR
jgi:hypothetical protein